MLTRIALIKVKRLEGMKTEINSTVEGPTGAMLDHLENIAKTAPRLGGSHTVEITATFYNHNKYIFLLELQHPSVLNIRDTFNQELYSIVQNKKANEFRNDSI